METTLNEALAWLTDDQVGQVVGTIGGLIAVLGTVVAVIRMLSPSFLSVLTKLFSAIINLMRRISFRQKVHCLKLRGAVLFSKPDSILELAVWRLEETNERELAYAQAILGNIEEAKALNPARAAWAIAVVRHPSEALEYIRPIKSESTINFIAFDGIAQLIDGLQGEEEVREWQRKTALTVPLANTIDAIAKLNRDIQFPKCLDDASVYLGSKPKLIKGWIPVRDHGHLEPVNLKRLRAIRLLVARSINCASLNSIALQLAVLISLEKKYRLTSNKQ